jgi:ferredoxin
VNAKIQIELIPLGVTLEVERGTALQAILAMHGVEFPCGGSSTCGGCRVQVIEGHLQPTAEDKALFSEEELAAGWRLACRARAETPLKLKVDQWTMPILADNEFPAGARRKGLAVAIDLCRSLLLGRPAATPFRSIPSQRSPHRCLHP